MKEIDQVKKQNEELKELLSVIVSLASNKNGTHLKESSVIIKIIKDYITAIEPT